jgi:DNA (cytosine-5)-methyltransferase 1
MLTVGSLFAGIGGFDLGFERAGFDIKWQVEVDPFCQKVLAKHWPYVDRYDDVRRVHSEETCFGCDDCLQRVDLVCGGFPCQPFSSASRGRRQGRRDDHYLWPAMLRLINELRPTWVVAENVTHLDGVALDAVVSDLETNGYQVAPPLEVPACAFGFDHWRPRLWILGHANGDGKSRMSVDAEVAVVPESRDDAGSVGASNGVSRGLDACRMAALGNAIVPQISEWIARRILDAEAAGGQNRGSVKDALTEEA